MNAIEFEKFLIEHEACLTGKDWAKGKTLEETYHQLERPSWLKWLLWNLGYQEKKFWVELSIIAAESMAQHDVGAAAIQAAKAWLEKPSKGTWLAARAAAADTAWVAAVDTDWAAGAASAAAAAWAAGAATADWAAWAAAVAADWATGAADAWATDAASDKSRAICDLWRQHVEEYYRVRCPKTAIRKELGV